MATANGTWTSNLTSGFIDLARRRSKEPKNHDLITGKEHFSHYTFDVDHRGVDMNGSAFIPISTKASVRSYVFN